jgi:hypothetical protein
LRIYISTYSLFKIGRLNINIKLALYKALIRSITAYSCPTWEYAADAHLLNLHCLQNRVLSPIGNLDRGTPVRELHVAFIIPYVYDYITKLCRAQAEITLTHVNPNVRGTGQGESRHRKDKRLKPGGGQAYDRSAD